MECLRDGSAINLSRISRGYYKLYVNPAIRGNAGGIVSPFVIAVE